MIDTAKLKAAAQEEIELRQVGDTSDNWQDLAKPEAFIELVAALEAARADCREKAERIAELESQRKLAFSACNRWADKCRDAEKRNAELDERLLRYAGIATQRAEHVAELEKRVAVLTGALNQTVSGYKSCLRTGHDRIIELGGECDAPEAMIAQNPDIRQAEKVLVAGINLETGGE
ncbi:hypothetical protein ACM92W_002478 [Cronobacter turicensis]